MYLKETTYTQTGRTYFAIVQGYRDEKGVKREKTIKPIGYLDVLEKEYENPREYFRKMAEEMDEARLSEEYILIKVSGKEEIQPNTDQFRNFGHAIFSKIYHELELDRFFNNKRRHENFKFNTNNIMKLLVYGRLLYPGSKKATWEIKHKFIDKMNFSLDDVYRSLTHFNKIEPDAQRFIHDRIVEKYQRSTELIYYDVTNYYFEIDKPDDFRKKGYSKEHRTDPIVQMGLAVDDKGIPIHYRLFEGNVHDSETLMPVLGEIKKQYNTKRIIVVADKGLNCGDNIAFNTALGDGYVFSQKVRGANGELKSFVLDDSGYTQYGDEYKSKSRVIPTEINVTVGVNANGSKKKKKMMIDQKQIVFYSKEYAERSRKQRETVLEKAADMVSNPTKYNKSTSYGAASYISNVRFDKKTGEVLDPGTKLFLDEEKIREEERLDGYYVIITSELDEKDSKIIDLYRGLWKIEDSFKVAKSELEARPVHVTKREHINSHFLTCFIALILARLVEIELEGRYTVSKILETVRKVECVPCGMNYFTFGYRDDVTDDMNKVFDLNIGQKYMTLGKIKKIFANTKNK